MVSEKILMKENYLSPTIVDSNAAEKIDELFLSVVARLLSPVPVFSTGRPLMKAPTYFSKKDGLKISREKLNGI